MFAEFCCLKILLLNQTFYPDVMATGQYLSELAVSLTERGHEVTVVTSRRAYDHPDTQFARYENWRGIKIFRIDATGFGKGARWRRASDFGSFLLACCLQLARLPRQDMVVALTSPPLIAFVGAWVARFWRAHFCYWVMDFNPDEAIAAGWLRAGSFTARVLERMSRFSLKRANRIIALDRFMHDRIIAKGIGADKIAVIPPWAQDTKVHFDAAGREAFRQRHGLGNKFVVMYSGNHSPCHPLDTLLEAARKLGDDNRFVFLFVGGGSEFQRVMARAEQGSYNNIRCLPYQPLCQLAGSLSAADLHVVVMGDPFVGLVHPCKIYNILAVGSPVLYIGPAPSHVAEILGTMKLPRFGYARHGDVNECVAQLRRIAGESEIGESGRIETMTVPFSQQVLLPKLVTELEKMSNG